MGEVYLTPSLPLSQKKLLSRSPALLGLSFLQEVDPKARGNTKLLWSLGAIKLLSSD